MKKDAFFSDGTSSYLSPVSPLIGEKVHFWFRASSEDKLKVYFLYGDKELMMEKKISKGVFDYYEACITLGEELLTYYYRIQDEEDCVYYGMNGFTYRDVDCLKFHVKPGFVVPHWAVGAVIYQIYTDRFCNGDPSNDVLTDEYTYIKEHVHHVSDWNRYPQAMDVREFYGGDIQGIIDKLDYLKDLGVEAIYCNPLFVSPSNHKYDTQDYDYIDPHIGVIVEDGGELLAKNDLDNKNASKYRLRTTSKKNLEASNALFLKLCQEVHKRDMRIIIDGVFNHCGSFNKWLDTEGFYQEADGYAAGAYHSADSPYRDYFIFEKKEDKNWPDNDSYKGWWNHNTLPKLNYEDSKELEDYILEVGRKWVSEPYCADGWRLDVAADLGQTPEYNHQFWKKFRKVVKEANPDALILAEHYGSPQKWLEGDEWDTVMNYDAFMEPITWYLTGMEKHSDAFRQELLGNARYFQDSMRSHMSSMMTPSLYTAMNQLSNHDHSRFLTRTNHKVGRIGTLPPEAAETGVNYAVMRQAIVMQMTWVGAPTLYYGDEAGVCGFTDPDSRRTYPWGKENQTLLKFYREMIHLHNKYLILKRGSIKILRAKEGIVAYGRFNIDEQIIVIVNASSGLKEINLEVWQAAVDPNCALARLIYTYENGYLNDLDEYYVHDGVLSLMMGPHSAIILKNKNW